jgi:hypothetical protein
MTGTATSPERGLCVDCGRNPRKSCGNGRWKLRCSPCNKKQWGDAAQVRHKRKRAPARLARLAERKRPWRVVGLTSLTCQECGFEAEHRCQIDIHHVDHDRSNNDPGNLRQLCANCHRLEHRDGPNRERAGRGSRPTGPR